MAEQEIQTEVTTEEVVPRPRENYNDWNVLGNILSPPTDYAELEVLTMDDLAKVPPGESFIQRNPESQYYNQRIVRNDASIPRITLGNPADDSTLLDLPDYGFYYNTETGELKQKEPESPSLGQRALERLIGTDIDARGWKVEVPRIVSTVAGGMIGSNIGSKIPPIPYTGFIVNPYTGALVFGGLGSALGSIAPEATMEMAESIGLAPEGWREEYGYSDDELRTLFMGEGVLDMAFGSAFTGLRLAGRPAVRWATHITKDAKELAQQARKLGVAMMPVQLGDRRIPKLYVPVMGRFPIWGRPFVKHGEEGAQKFQEAVSGLPARFHPIQNSSSLARDMFAGARRLVQQVEKDFGTRYDDIFKRAADNNVRVVPTNSLEEAGRIRQAIENSRTVNPSTGAMSNYSPAQNEFLKIIEEIENLKVVDDPMFPGVPALATKQGEAISIHPQNLEAMDGMLSRLDDIMARLNVETGGKLPDNLGQYHADLSNMIKADVVGNVVQATKNADGSTTFLRNADTANIGQDLRELDTEFAYLMNSVYETSAAKQFMSVRRGGLRGVTKPSQENLRKSVDTLSEYFYKLLPNNPEMVNELARILPPTEMQQFKSGYLQNLINSARTGDTLNIEKLQRAFGFDDINSNAYLSLKRLLGVEARDTTAKGMPRWTAENVPIDGVQQILSMDNLDEMIRIGDALSSVEIPNASLFLQRRLMLGGLRSGMGGVLPVAAGAAAGTGRFGPGARTMGALPRGGVRLLSNMLANPATSQPLLKVLDEEASQLVKKQNFVRILKGAIKATATGAGWGWDETQELMAEVDIMAKVFGDAEEDPSILENPPDEVIELEEQIAEEEAAQAAADQAAIAVPPIAAPPALPITETVLGPAAQFTDPNLLAAQQMPAPAPAPAPPAGGGVDSAMRERYAALYPDDMVSDLIGQGVGSLPA